MKNYLEFRRKLGASDRANVHSLTSLERYIFISSLLPLRGNQGTQTLAGRNWGNDSSDAITSPFSPFSLPPSLANRESRALTFPSVSTRLAWIFKGWGCASCIQGGRQIFLSMQYANIIHRHAPSVPFFPWRGPPGDPVRIIPHLTLTTRPTILHPRSFYLSPLVATFSKRWFLETRESIRSCTVELLISENRVKRLFWIFCQN